MTCRLPPSTLNVHVALEANAAKWTDIAVATLAFARSSADIDQWRHDNRRYLARLQKAHPAQYQRIEYAIVALGPPKQ
jgi:hypothetical protein